MGFINRILGVGLNIPAGFSEISLPDEPVQAQSAMLIKVANQPKVLNATIGQGEFNGETAVLLDLAVSQTQSVAASEEDLLSALSASRAVIHDCFFKLTEKIHEKMLPSSGDN
jgi:uncharacterized protein (TIGR04255 family)